jgi:serine/threonine-protein kinase
MTSEQWAKVKEVVAAALDLPAAERPSFIERACGKDRIALGEALSLLKMDGSDVRTAGAPASEPARVAGFTPGTMLAGRYRIVALLGRGGMGEVYRADDLKLGQTVALKFLPRTLALDVSLRDRFFKEVRITRQLSHPNICRVYDIAEFEGQHFLSMEYVDGEDLASLIKRIGYLSNEKALEITRQLLAGLAAAHERGVLHRDLKPANIMLDGRGRVRIMDFGIAVASADETQHGEICGTPAYMAPEQFTGTPATERSDIYSIGLVLYEIYCGKRAFADLQRRAVTPKPPSEVRQAMDPIVEQLMMRCLEADPQSRPASAAELAAALPGGDPLAATLAAGETPSPAMVAASGSKLGLRPATAVALLAFTTIAALVGITAQQRVQLFLRLPPGKPPEVLAERAREFLRKAGYQEAPVDGAHGFALNDAVLNFIQNSDNSRDRWDSLNSTDALTFWHRRSPRPLVHDSPRIGIASGDPTMRWPGETLVRLDREGRLRQFVAIPSQDDSPQPYREPDWRLLFLEAGLDLSRFTPVEPQRSPPFFADARATWEGPLSDIRRTPVRIEAAAYRGRPVYFDIIPPWEQPPFRPLTLRGQARLLVLLLGFIVLVALYQARRNLRLGREDRRGTLRLVLTVLAIRSAEWLFGEHHTGELITTLTTASTGIARILFTAAQIGIVYVVIEPVVRRRWPQMLVSWTRILHAQWSDPAVGRDVLIGCAAGVTYHCLLRLRVLAPALAGFPETRPVTTLSLSALMGAGPFISAVFAAIAYALYLSALALLAVIMLRLLLRKEWAVLVAGPFFFALLQISANEFPWVTGAITLAMNALVFVILARLGFVATFSLFFAWTVLSEFPITLRTSDWYFSYGVAALGLVAAFALYGFRTALGGRRILEIQY